MFYRNLLSKIRRNWREKINHFILRYNLLETSGAVIIKCVSDLILVRYRIDLVVEEFLYLLNDRRHAGSFLSNITKLFT